MPKSLRPRRRHILTVAAVALLAMPSIAVSRGVHLQCAHDLGADPSVIAARADAARGRVWILAQDGLYLYAFAHGDVRRFDLPNWRYVIRFACPPDLAVAPDGSVVVSSNAMASLWRIDAALTRASELPLHFEKRVEGEEDFGLSAMELAEPGIVWAQGAADHSRWRVDLETGFALPVPDAAFKTSLPATASSPRHSR